MSKARAKPAKVSNRSDTWTTAKVADIWGVTTTRVTQMTSEARLQPVRRGEWDKEAISRVFVQYWRNKDRRGNKTVAAASVQKARARDIEVRTQERLRLLISTAEAEELLDGFWGIVRTELAGLAARCTRDLGWRRLIDDAVYASLQRIADRCGEIGRLLRSGTVLGDALTATKQSETETFMPQASPVPGGEMAAAAPTAARR